jgi:predicted ribosome-associated RNA-binding protein Tma20
MIKNQKKQLKILNQWVKEDKKMPKNMSVATINSPEFINITGISPLVSKSECKVFYLGHNRNGSHIDKAIAEKMAQTLPGCPVVGYYSESKEDFRDHGDLITIDGDGVKFKCQTTPYGFVAPDAKVWFKDFEDTDEFGNKIIRTYLMTECYLWTGQYEEAMRVYNEGRPQSMELDEKTLKGFWSTDNNCGMDFFIINDAIISKLCILGEDIEPCFEGASVTAPKVSSSFTLDNGFKNTLFTMMEELKELTKSTLEKGEKDMELENKDAGIQEKTSDLVIEETSTENFEKKLQTEDKIDSESNVEIQNTIEEFKKKEDESENDSSKEASDNSTSESDDETDKEKEKKEESAEDEKKKTPSKNSLEEVEQKYAILEQQYNELQEKFTALEKQNEELVEFKLKIEDQKKEELINSFYMLSDEDKKEVIENKSKYSLDEIKKELSVICVDKKVNFVKEEKENIPTIFNLTNSVGSDLPDWLKAVEENKENK